MAGQGSTKDEDFPLSKVAPCGGGSVVSTRFLATVHQAPGERLRFLRQINRAGTQLIDD